MAIAEKILEEFPKKSCRKPWGVETLQEFLVDFFQRSLREVTEDKLAGITTAVLLNEAIKKYFEKGVYGEIAEGGIHDIPQGFFGFFFLKKNILKEFLQDTLEKSMQKLLRKLYGNSSSSPRNFVNLFRSFRINHGRNL